MLILRGLAIAALLAGSPLLGALLAGHPIQLYLEFPPITQYVRHAPFSWPVFGLLGLFALFIVAGFASLYFPANKHKAPTASSRPFPMWGWFSLAAMALFWTMAWTRWNWVQPFRDFFFPLLWAAYIVTANALSFRRSGFCYLTRAPRELLLLFPASALFWWYFEYLNRFVQSWHYFGIEDYGPFRYFLKATLAFSTVLPAFASTLEFLSNFPALRHPRYTPSLDKRLAGLALLLGVLGLMGSALWPDYLFWAIWLSPLFLVWSLLALSGQPWPEPWEGDFIFLSALAGLVCGFFWEMWNYYSLPKWVYSIPFVERFHLFEMPLLGYLGYLPFGILCWMVSEQVIRLAPSLSNRPKNRIGKDRWDRPRSAGLPSNKPFL